jgi:transposase-like protein
MTVGGGLMTKEPQFDSSETEDSKRKALEALESRGSRHDAATAADVSVKTLDDWRRGDAQFAAEWDATIDRVMKRLREQPLDDKGNFKRSPLQYGLKATDENKEIVLAMLANGATYAAAAAAIGAHRRTIMKWADADEEFAQRWNDAIEEGKQAQPASLRLIARRCERPSKWQSFRNESKLAGVATTLVVAWWLGAGCECLFLARLRGNQRRPGTEAIRG